MLVMGITSTETSMTFSDPGRIPTLADMFVFKLANAEGSVIGPAMFLVSVME